MSSVFTPTPVALGDITIPSDGDGPGVKAADVNVPLCAIADGVTYITAAVTAEIARTTPLASLTALAAITAPADGTVRHVLGFGFFVFKTSATTGHSPFRVAAADATAGGWVSGTAYETTVSRLVPCSLISGISGTAGGALAQVAGTSTSVLFVPLSAGDAQIKGGSFYCNRTFTGATNYQAYYLPLDEFLVDGAFFFNAALYFRPIAGHVGVPSRMPKVAIVRSGLAGYTPSIDNFTSITNGYTALATPVSAAAYEVDNVINAPIDQNNTIDRSAYRYGAIILDDAGTNAIVGNAYHALKFDLTSTDARRS